MLLIIILPAVQHAHIQVICHNFDVHIQDDMWIKACLSLRCGHTAA